jgi:uncharacterized protein YdeI (YjbR/CyaY-like superfamily)
MAKKDPRVDAYIAAAAAFAKPVLKHLRRLVHTGCPEVEETIKWQFPTFMHQGMLCSLAAFKQHCTFGFWKHALIIEQNPATRQRAQEAMGQLGRLTSLSDLPSDKVLLSYLKTAVCLNEAGIKVPRAHKPRAKRGLVVPDFFTTALRKNKRASVTFENFSSSHRREYIEWLTEAKRDETRAKRLAKTMTWLAEGKSRNWKHASC